MHSQRGRLPISPRAALEDLLQTPMESFRANSVCQDDSHLPYLDNLLMKLQSQMCAEISAMIRVEQRSTWRVFEDALLRMRRQIEHQHEEQIVLLNQLVEHQSLGANQSSFLTAVEKQEQDSLALDVGKTFQAKRAQIDVELRSVADSFHESLDRLSAMLSRSNPVILGIGRIDPDQTQQLALLEHRDCDRLGVNQFHQDAPDATRASSNLRAYRRKTGTVEASDAQDNRRQKSDLQALQETLGLMKSDSLDVEEEMAPGEKDMQDSSKVRQRNRVFILSMMLVCVNCIVIGIQITVGVHAAKEHKAPPTWCLWADIAFMIAFIFEIGIRVHLDRKIFFVGPHRNWNMFDCLCTVSTTLDVALSWLDVSFMRSLRLMRVFRITRLLGAFRSIRALRMMVASIICSLTSLMWAVVLLSFLLYLFAIFIMQGIEHHIYQQSVQPNKNMENLLGLYGTVDASMLTLFMSITGGKDWGETVKPLQDVTWMYSLFYVSFVTFVLFGVMNVLTAIFVDSARHVAQVDQEVVIQEEISREESVVRQLKMLFKKHDVNRSGNISKDELEYLLSQKETHAYLNLLGLDVSETRGLFQLLDIDDDQEVSIDELVHGIMRLKGSAKGLDLATVMFENKKIHVRMDGFMRFVEDQFCLMEQRLGVNSKGTLASYMTEEERKHHA